MAYQVTIEDGYGTIISNLQYDSRSEAIRNAKGGAKREQGRAVISDAEDVIVYEFKYEDDGQIRGYDDLGNSVFNV